jgi:NADH-quinone oxidoreductase subunit N
MSGTVITSVEYAAASAEIFLLTAICAILLIDVFLSDSKRWITYALSLATLAGTAFVTVTYGVDARVPAFHGTFIADPMGDVLKLFA